MSEQDSVPADEPVAKRIDTRLLRPRDCEIVVDEAGAETVYTIRGNLPIDTMVDLLDLEDRVKACPDGDARQLIMLCDEANELLLELVRERHPDVGSLGFGVDEVLGVLAALANNVSVAHEVADALTGSGTQNREQRRAATKRPPRKRATARPKPR